MTLLEFFIIAALIIAAYRIVNFYVKRAKFMIALLRIGKMDGVRVEFKSPYTIALPWQTKRSAATIEVGNKRYSVRILNGKGYLYSVHMASPEYAVTYVKSEGGVKVRIFGQRTVRTNAVSSGVYLPRTVYIPPREEEGVIPITVLNPAPREMTYVTPSRTSVSIAFEGDTVMGERIFTASTLESFIDRDSRGFFDD